MLLEILKYPDPRLRVKCKPVDKFDEELKKIVNDMAETMYNAPGVGLAAPQVGIDKRLFIIDISKEKNDLKVFINPTILKKEGEICDEEGCLSVPGEYANVTRAEVVEAVAQDINGNEFIIKADGLMARAIQHELDHLNGTLFLDRLPAFKRESVKKHIKRRQLAGEY
ncbi:peptide deformylase [Calditerrivibrio nitroreducens]|uniref:Peptide deformylase n=1 Tax=Calditerrivibrio nitroreducens (strain DSM 19672 / NBRC 101217 / Yu37-1) TaxID=768670 RepID=E4TH48_CALNY|nr:peptide deformylase [Calditerrivibrio nitroreducens]ADR19846.1 peptide deformylase [Calditerrivibrio nitroreducens DSM 19672]